MGRRGGRLVGTAVLLLCALLLPSGCLENPSQADRDAVRGLLTQYLQDRAIRLTEAGARFDGTQLTSVRLSKKFANRTAGDAAKIDAKRRSSKQRYARAEVSVELKDLDYNDDEVATATIHDETTLFRAPGDDSGPDATRFSTDREFTLDRIGHGWALAGQRILGPDLEETLPDTDAPG